MDRLFNFRRGYYPGLDERDGSDFFIPEKTIAPTITSRVYKATKSAKLTHIVMENLANVELPLNTKK
jgi:hypothetical protein